MWQLPGGTRLEIGIWGSWGGALVKGLVWFGVSGCSMAHLLCWSLVRPIFRDIGSKENIVGRPVSLLAGEWDIGVEMECGGAVKQSLGGADQG